MNKKEYERFWLNLINQGLNDYSVENNLDTILNVSLYGSNSDFLTEQIAIKYILNISGYMLNRYTNKGNNECNYVQSCAYIMYLIFSEKNILEKVYNKYLTILKDGIPHDNKLNIKQISLCNFRSVLHALAIKINEPFNAKNDSSPKSIIDRFPYYSYFPDFFKGSEYLSELNFTKSQILTIMFIDTISAYLSQEIPNKDYNHKLHIDMLTTFLISDYLMDMIYKKYEDMYEVIKQYKGFENIDKINMPIFKLLTNFVLSDHKSQEQNT